MKKFIAALITAIIMCSACGVGATEAAEATPTTSYFQTMETAHEIAELARSMGLSESDSIILRCQEIWWDAYDDFCVDRDAIACLVYNEAWGGCSDRHRELVAQVVLNRVADSRFPDTVVAVIVQKGQYLPAYVDPTSYYGEKARADATAWATCQAIAEKALRGEIDCPSNVIYQANFVQGTGVYETHYTSYSTTYFCYG